MKKSKRNSLPRKRKPATKKTTDSTSALKGRLLAEFAEAMKSAKSYVANPERLRLLFEEATKEAASLPKEPFRDTWPFLQAMLRLIRAYYRGEYHAITESTLVVIVAAIIYLVSPLDVIPDAIPTLGFLDDATVLALAVQRTRQDLDDFMIWETASP